jgi:DNA mismatch endonuclease, patch repair protein
VFSSIRACVFVHGCFWHGCRRCVDGKRKVKSKSAYWIAKIAGNRVRDRRHLRSLVKAGWKVYVIWECEIKQVTRLETIATQLLHRRRSSTR